MRSYLIRTAVFFLAVFAALVLLGERLKPFFNYFGDGEQVHTVLMSVSLIIGISSLALVMIRTVMGIILLIIIVIAIFILVNFGLKFIM